MYYMFLYCMDISIESHRAAIGQFSSHMHVIRYHLGHVSFTLLNFAVVFVLMLAFYTQVICLSSNIHINPGPVSLPNYSLARLNVRSFKISAFLSVHNFDILLLRKPD